MSDFQSQYRDRHVSIGLYIAPRSERNRMMQNADKQGEEYR